MDLELNTVSTQPLQDVIASGLSINVRHDNKLIWEYISFNPNCEKYAAKFKQKAIDEYINWNILSHDSNGSYTHQ